MSDKLLAERMREWDEHLSVLSDTHSKISSDLLREALPIVEAIEKIRERWGVNESWAEFGLFIDKVLVELEDHNEYSN